MRSLTFESPSFAANEPIPAEFTADGPDRSPPFRWGALPEGTRSLALICEDPDAPGPLPFVHWLIADLEPERTGHELDEGGGSFPGAVEGTNGFGRVGYGGPEPPRGSGTHHYHFRLHALDTRLRLTEGFTKDELLKAMGGHVLGAGELVGTYRR